MMPESRSAYPGERLGLPETGPGSLAPMGRRLGALMIDWLIALGIAFLAVRSGLVPPNRLHEAQYATWLGMGIVAVRLFGMTPGQLCAGIGVAALDGRPVVGLGRAVVRAVLVGIVLPALFTDADGRGLQDRVTGTAVIRRR
ncbi:RDD family protein [Mycobacterium sp. E2733]|uniref:RDD family protein n=1 Tax=Mycobacterium sp. E2733 TaxID=1834138 RepID=UPI0007FFEEAA|nr:RDD family protein [Mycobacterium sp. E2733]OBH91499.1 hypothetical protein A5678_10915 [Mycobacterium sp. E2733]